MKIKVVSQTQALFEGEAEFVSVPGVKGRMGILPGHTSVVSLLDVGELRIKTGGKETTIAVDGGVVTVKNNVVTVLANEAVLAEDIVKDEIDDAIEMAKKKLSSKLSPTEMIQLEKQIRYQKLKKRV